MSKLPTSMPKRAMSEAWAWPALRWRLRHGFSRAAVLWLAAAALMLAALGLLGWTQFVLKREWKMANAALANPKTLSALPAASAPSSAAELDAFYRGLPRQAESFALTGRIFAAAAAHGVALEQVEYRLVAAPGSRVLRYELTLPLKAPYPAVRRFVRQALLDSPSLALTGLSFSRAQADAPQLESEVRLTLFVERE